MFSLLLKKIEKTFSPEKNVFFPSYETLHSEANSVSVNCSLFSGLRIQIGKALSPFCFFQQGFIIDSITQPSAYNIGGILSKGKNYLHASFEPETKTFNAKTQAELFSRAHLKMQTQANFDSNQRYLQLETEYIGSHSNVSIKIINPKIKSKEGIFVGNGIKRLAKGFALGGEFVFQKEKEVDELNEIKKTTRMGHGISVRCTSEDNSSVFCLTLQNFSSISSSYYHKLNDYIELGTEMYFSFSENKKEAVCSTSAKAVHGSTAIRTMIDTAGKLGVLLEEKISNGVFLFLSGELTDFNTVGKAGIGISVDC